MSEDFPRWLRARLRSQGWIVAEFARAVGVRPAAVYRWTAGQRVPTDQQVAQIAAVLQVSEETIWEILARQGVTPIGPIPATAERAAPRPAVAPSPDRPFARWLRRQLAQRGWSPGAFARQLDLDPVTVRAWLGGRRLPAAVLLSRLAAVFDVDLETLRTLTDEPSS